MPSRCADWEASGRLSGHGKLCRRSDWRGGPRVLRSLRATALLFRDPSDIVRRPSDLTGAASAVVVYTASHDDSDHCAAGPQRALPLRFGKEIQTLLTREGRQEGRGRTRKSCEGGTRAGRCDRRGAGLGPRRKGTEAKNGSAMESRQLELNARVRAALTHAAEGRRRVRDAEARVHRNRGLVDPARVGPPVLG